MHAVEPASYVSVDVPVAAAAVVNVAVVGVGAAGLDDQ